MKKLIIILVVLGLSGSAVAQNRKIEFEKGTFREALQKAREVGRPLFVDCYTTWCGPCKGMDAGVFTQDSVADFFNANMVSLKLDMESEDGKQYMKPFEVTSFPTFLIIDHDGKIFYRFLGGMDSGKFMAHIRTGLDPENRVAMMKRRYDAGGYDRDFLREYIKLKLDLYETHEAKIMADEFFESLTHKERILPENWFMFGEPKYTRALSDMGSRNFKYLVEHWADFAAENGYDAVYEKLASIYYSIASYAIRGWYFRDREYDPAEFDGYISEIKTVDLPDKEQYIAMMRMAKAAGAKDYNEVGNILADNIGGFTVANQQIMFDYIGAYYNAKNHPRYKETVRLVLDSGKESNLATYLRSLEK